MTMSTSTQWEENKSSANLTGGQSCAPRSSMPDARYTKIDPQYIKLLKLGVAIAIIRTKPPGTSAQQHAQQLCNQFQQSQLNWKAHSHQLQQQLLQTKQKLLLSQAAGQVPSKSQEATEGEPQDIWDVNRDSGSEEGLPLFPTPPCSSEGLLSEQINPRQLHQHTGFLQAVLSLRTLSKSEKPGNICGNSNDQETWRNTTHQTIIYAIQTIEKCVCGEDPMKLSDKVLQSAIQVVIDLVESEMIEAFIDDVLQNTAHLLQTLVMKIINSSDLNQVSCQKRLCQVILMFGRSGRLQGGVIKLLTHFVVDYSSHLQEVCSGKSSIQPHQYENMYFIFWCLRQILETSILAKSIGESLSEDVMVIVEKELQDSLLNISEDFPLFAHFVWEIGGLLQNLLMIKNSIKK